jgi:hypothetical protein
VDRLSAGLGAVMASIPPPGRLRMWQARAILDDLADWRARAATEALRRSPGEEPPAVVAAWTEANAEDLRRAVEVVPSGLGDDALAAASLSLRRLARTINR